MTKFTPAYIAMCRKAKGGVWVFSEVKAALDEIERSHDMTERLIKAAETMIWWANCCSQDNVKQSLKSWNAITSEWRSR